MGGGQNMGGAGMGGNAGMGGGQGMGMKTAPEPVDTGPMFK